MESIGAPFWKKSTERSRCSRLYSDLKYGVAVRFLRSKNPGKVLYEDDFQIVVREWKRL